MGWLKDFIADLGKRNKPNDPYAKMFVECSRKSGKSMAQLADWLGQFPQEHQIEVLENLHDDILKKEKYEETPKPMDTGQLQASGTFVPLTHRAPKTFTANNGTIKVTEGHPSGLTGREVAKHSTLHTNMRHGEKTLTEKAEAARAQTQVARPTATVDLTPTQGDITGVVALSTDVGEALVMNDMGVFTTSEMLEMTEVAARALDKSGFDSEMGDMTVGLDKLKDVLKVAHKQGHLDDRTYKKLIKNIEDKEAMDSMGDIDVADFIGLEEDEFL